MTEKPEWEWLKQSTEFTGFTQPEAPLGPAGPRVRVCHQESLSGSRGPAFLCLLYSGPVALHSSVCCILRLVSLCGDKKAARGSRPASHNTPKARGTEWISLPCSAPCPDAPELTQVRQKQQISGTLCELQSFFHLAPLATVSLICLLLT